MDTERKPRGIWRARRRLSLAAIAAAALLGGLSAASLAGAEVSQSGGVIVNFDGGISPESLPRSGTAPVAVSVDTTVRAVDGADPPPQLRQITIGINRNGKLFDRVLYMRGTSRDELIERLTAAAAAARP